MGSEDIVQLLLQKGADPVVQSVRYLHLIHEPGYQQNVYAKPSKLDRAVVLSRNLISVRSHGIGEASAQIWKGLWAAVIGVHDNDGANREVLSGSFTEHLWLLPEVLRTRKFRRKAGSSETHSDASGSLSTLSFMLRKLHETTNILGFWRLSFSGTPSRRIFNRLLRPRVPRDHVRLTWICVSCLLTLASI